MEVGVVAFAVVVALAGSEPKPIVKSEDLVFLKDIAGAVVEASRVAPDAKVGEIGPNTTGGVLIRPGGRACYPAFWIRDYAMSLESGLISREEQRHALLLTASNQPDETRTLRSGAVVPAGSIADHITFDGKPIFFPGTLDDYEGQGGGQWGTLPALDDHFFFIHMAAEYVRLSGDAGILDLIVNGKSLMIRLEAAFRMPPSREDSGLVYAEADRRGVTFGFVDAVTHTGDLLFCSLLKRRAALEMAEFLEKRGDLDAARGYRDTAEKLRCALPSFATKQGLLRASTGVSAQPDVWGSAFAVYTDALDEPLRGGVCNALATYYLQGQLAWRGNIRHVPTSEDFSETSAWESAASPKNRYQNGAYWGTPTGWVCYAIAQVNPEASHRLVAEYIQELREGDFRKGPEFGSPWECMHPDGGHRQNPVYMTSITCPLAAFRRLAP